VHLGKQISQPLSRKNFSLSSAFRPRGIRPKSTSPMRAVGRNPLALRIWISGSISAWVVPALHTKYRIPGLNQNSFVSDQNITVDSAAFSSKTAL
jgi:hypothetical protein